jgi:Fic family protein
MPWDEETVAYVTPDRNFVDQELPKLIAFANDENTEEVFIHPLTKAIMLHFWVGLLHPFEDGNGRLARILFYWYMLRKGYWAFSYLSLSEYIIKSPKQYAMAYIYTEQDNYDLNYFIHYNMDKLKFSREQFKKHLKHKISQNRQTLELAKSNYHFNERQWRLLHYLVKDEQRYTTPSIYHHNNQDISYGTVHADLKKLISEGLLTRVKSGRVVYYYPTVKIQTILS